MENLYDIVIAEAVHDYDPLDRYDDDRRLDAEREEWDDKHPPDMECPDCGYEWWGNWTRASRDEPSQPRNEDCPRCCGDVD